MSSNLIIILIIILGSGFDCISTYIVASKFKGKEQNPFLRMLMKRLGLKALIIWFPLEILMNYLIFKISEMISSIILFRVMIILIPWIAGIINIYQFVLLSRQHS